MQGIENWRKADQRTHEMTPVLEQWLGPQVPNGEVWVAGQKVALSETSQSSYMKLSGALNNLIIFN
jgi:hypothetical protein